MILVRMFIKYYIDFELYRGNNEHKQSDIAGMARRNLKKLQGDFARMARPRGEHAKEPSAKEIVEEFKADLKGELITVTDLAGREVTFPKGATVLDLASDIGRPLCYLATGAIYKYPDGSTNTVGIDEPLVDGVNVTVLKDETDERDFVEKLLEQVNPSGGLGNYQGMLDRFRIAKTYKAK